MSIPRHYYGNFESPEHALACGVILGALVAGSASVPNKLITDIDIDVDGGGDYTNMLFVTTGNQRYRVTVDVEHGT